MRQIVLDTETTGLEVDQGHRVIEIGCIELFNRRPTGNNLHQYLNPDREIDAGAVAEAELAKVTDKAKKAVEGVKAAAVDAQKKAGVVGSQAKASADKVAATVKADAKKVVGTVKKDVGAIKQRVGSVLDIKPKAAPVKKPVVAVKPSANSRANRATSKAKKAAGSVVDAVKKMG